MVGAAGFRHGHALAMALWTRTEVQAAIEKKVPIKPHTRRRRSKENSRVMWLDDATVLRVRFPKGHPGDLPLGTARSIGNDLWLTESEFDDFVECRLTGPNYEELIREIVRKRAAAEKEAAAKAKKKPPPSTKRRHHKK